MGYVVDCKDETVWLPSLKVGDYFVAHIKSLEKLIETQSGITDYVADSLEIDPVIFNDFVEKALNFIEKSNNTPMIAMMSGIVQVIVNLNQKINGFEPKITAKNQRLIENSKKVFYPAEEYLS